jgi:hypothetical protein
VPKWVRVGGENYRSDFTPTWGALNLLFSFLIIVICVLAWKCYKWWAASKKSDIEKKKKG